MYYAEEWSHGKWRPVTYDDKPVRQQKDGRKETTSGVGPLIQKIQPVPVEFQNEPLEKLQERLGS